MLDNTRLHTPQNISCSNIPQVDITSMNLDGILTEHEIFRIAQWAESRLMHNPNEPIELLSGHTTILGMFLDGRKEHEKSSKVAVGSPEWLNCRETVRGYGKRFARTLATHIRAGRAEPLTTLCYSGFGELVKNTFDHADASSFSLVITQKSGNNYFVYRDYLTAKKEWMIHRFRNTGTMAEKCRTMNDTECMHQLLSPTKTTKSASWVNCWLGLSMICSWIKSNTLDVSIHTDGYRFDISNLEMDFVVNSSTLPPDIWYIATPKI